jgi:hypothetical protein
MLWTIFVVLLILWLGFSLPIREDLIKLLLVVGSLIVVVNVLSGRRSAI